MVVESAAGRLLALLPVHRPARRTDRAGCRTARVEHLLRRHFPDGVVLATLIAITFGTNLFHYAMFDPAYSHVYSFCLLAVLLAFTDEWWERRPAALPSD